MITEKPASEPYCWYRSAIVFLLAFISLVAPRSTWAQRGGMDPMEALHQGARDGNWHFVEGMTKNLVAPEGSNNQYSPLVEWYYGIALHKLNRNAEAERMLLQALANTKSSTDQTEVKLWLAQVSLKRGQYVKAYKLLKAIPIISDGNKAWYLSIKRTTLRQASLDSLLEMRSSAGDEPLALTIRDRITYGEGNDAERAQALDYLKVQGLEPVVSTAATAKQELEVAVLLPIGTRREDVRKANRGNQAWLDIYLGLQLARKHLADSGLALNFHVYDMKNGFDWAQYLLQMDELADAHMVIGPVVAQGSDRIAAWANKKRVPMLNPITNKAHWPESNAWAWITECPAELTGISLAKTALKELPCNKVAVVYGPNEQDTIIARAYAKVMRDSGKKVVLYHKVGKNSAANLPKFLLQSGLDSTGHIFAPNDEEIVKVQLPSTLALIKMKCAVLTYGEWLNGTQFNPEWAERWNVLFGESHLYSAQQPAVKSFQEQYSQEYKVWPSTIAAQAYESLMAYGRVLKNSPGAWQPKLATNLNWRGALGSPFDYSKGTRNAAVPVWRLRNMQLEAVE